MSIVDTNRVVVVFRNDDLSARSDVEHERRIAGIFERYNVPQTIGVIPRCTTDSYRNPDNHSEIVLLENPQIVEFLRQYVEQSGSEIALHGYTHRTNQFSQPARREFFEFRYLTLEEQAERIRQGTDIIDGALGVRPTTFIPPWNRLDMNTLYACQRNAYRIASAGVFTPTLDGLASLGTDCSIESFPAKLMAALRAAPGRIFLRILFHSATIRTEGEVAALERTVSLATQTAGCEVMTLRDAVLRYAEEVQQVNEAARNSAAQDEVIGSVRARAVVYRRTLSAIGVRTDIEKAYATARNLYIEGRYKDGCIASWDIEHACRKLLVAGRLLAGGVGLLTAITVHVFMRSFLGWEDLMSSVVVALSLLIVGGVVLYRWATAEDTKEEIRTAAQAALIGAMVGLALVPV